MPVSITGPAADRRQGETMDASALLGFWAGFLQRWRCAEETPEAANPRPDAEADAEEGEAEKAVSEVPYQYIVVRKDLDPLRQMIHVGHAAGESVKLAPIPDTTNLGLL